MVKLLVPGCPAPDFELADTAGRVMRLSELQGRNVVLAFFPSRPADELIEQLVKLEGKRVDLEAGGAVVVGISPADRPSLQALAGSHGLRFSLLSDAGAAVARRYGVVSEAREDDSLAALFVLDDQGVVRRVYDPAAYPSLPNPAMALRALNKLAETPRAAPVTADDWCFGPPDAPVTLVEYADYQCEPCGETFRVLQQVLPLYRGRVRLVFRHFPIRFSHPLAQKAAEAAEAAGAQGKFWEMHTRLFEARGDLAPERLVEFAREIGLDIGRFTEDLASGRHKEKVNEDFATATRNKIRLPPALFINGVFLEGPRTKDSLCAVIDGLLACTQDRQAESPGLQQAS
jgi:peroxiredoxin